jgi:hypothetical protein
MTREKLHPKQFKRVMSVRTQQLLLSLYIRALDKSGPVRKKLVTVAERRLGRLWPFLTKLNARLALLPRKKLVAGFIVGATAVIILVSHLLPPSGPVPTLLPRTPSTASKPATPAITTPDYATVLPAGKSINDYGGWTRVSPPDRNPVFAYLDKIGHTPINVSEQPLPDAFKSDTAAQVAQLAQGFKANEKIVVGSTTVYIGTSAKGPQSIIFSKNNLLILIKSSLKVENDQWKVYINSLL